MRQDGDHKHSTRDKTQTIWIKTNKQKKYISHILEMSMQHYPASASVTKRPKTVDSEGVTVRQFTHFMFDVITHKTVDIVLLHVSATVSFPLSSFCVVIIL